MYWESVVSGIKSSLDRLLMQMSCLEQSCHPFPEALLHLKLLGTDFINGRPSIRKLHEFKANAPIMITIDWNILDLGVLSLEPPPIDLLIASL